MTDQLEYYSVKTRKSDENIVADMIIDADHDEIHTVLVPQNIVCYVIVEAESESLPILERVVDDVPNARKVVDGRVKFSEIEDFLEEKSDVKDLETGAIVEIIDGPFKGDKAQITEIDRQNEKVRVEKLDAQVKIPIELKGSDLRVLDKEEQQ